MNVLTCVQIAPEIHVSNNQTRFRLLDAYRVDETSIFKIIDSVMFTPDSFDDRKMDSEEIKKNMRKKKNMKMTKIEKNGRNG